MSLKQIYAFVLKTIIDTAGVDAAKKFDAMLRDHKSLNLKTPVTLADKVSFIELHDQSPLASKCTDKYEVRSFVKEKGLESILIPLAYDGCWTKENEIDFDDLPNSFALKATHGCKMNYIVQDKSKLNVEECRREVSRWLKTTYGTYSMEPHYINIPHRVYAEQFLEEVNKLNDYKFHCLNGIPRFVLVCSDRKTDGDKAMKVTLDLFDMQWNHLNEVIGSGSEVPGNGTVRKPDNFLEMVEIAKRLSQDFKFVRVDLYEHDGKVLFGELTFTPAHCVFPYLSEKFNLEMGRLLKI